VVEYKRTGSNLYSWLSAFAVSYGLTRKRLSGDRNRRKEEKEKRKEERSGIRVSDKVEVLSCLE